jgi:DNA-binding transcriptional ArsR family regulator
LATQRPPALTNPRLAMAMSHPTRLRTMRVVSERTATPREIADEIDEPINNVAYHVKVLAKLGCIELVRVQQARGGRVAEHYYRASQRPYFDADAWDQLGESEKLDVVSAIMHEITDDIAVSMSHGSFYDPDDNHLSRTPMVLDDDGWQEVISLLDGAVDGLLEIQEKVNERGVDAAETMLAKVEIIHFRSPTPKGA